MKKIVEEPHPKRDVKLRHFTPTGKKSRTKQADAKACDINEIIKRHAQTGNISHLNPKSPQFGDYSNSVDLHQAMNAVQQAKQRFAELPSAIRAAAHNRPENFLAMLESQEGQDELVALGLELDGYEAPQKPLPTPDPNSVAPEPTEKPAEKKSA